MKTITVVIEGLLLVPLPLLVHYLWRRIDRENLDKELERRLVFQSIGIALCWIISMALRSVQSCFPHSVRIFSVPEAVLCAGVYLLSVTGLIWGCVILVRLRLRKKRCDADSETPWYRRRDWHADGTIKK